MANELAGLPGDPNKATLVALNEVSAIEAERATAESQAGFVVAKRFPRNEDRALNRIINSCQRKSLAEQAEYAFPKGGQMVTGPSIRLAEVIAQNWGNILYGMRELAEIDGASMMMAYCYDLETNTRAERIFSVKHVRKARGETTKLTDARDIYEINANQGARRLRACILQVVPGDVVELAVEACRATLQATDADASESNIEKMLKAFAAVDVTKEMIEKRMGKKTEALRPPEMVTLRKIYTSINDGMSRVSQWFEVESATSTEKLKEKLQEVSTTKKKRKKAKKQPSKAAEPEGEPEPEEPPPEKPEEEPGPEEPESEEDDDDEPDLPNPYEASTVEVGPKPSQWAAQVEGLKNRALTAGASHDEWHEAVITILEQMGYQDINAVPNTKRPPLKNALVVLVEALEEQSDD